MAEAQIPTRGDVNNFFIDIDLLGVTRRFNFLFNFRWSRWIVGIYDQSGNAIVDGLPMQVGVELLSQFVSYPEVPPGFYVPLDQHNLDDSYVLADLGNRILLGVTDGH